MKSSDIEKKLCIKKATLRYYEDEGFIQPKRDKNGYRNYSEEELNRLKLILQLRTLDISIMDIKAIIQGTISLEECLSLKRNKIEEEKRDLKDMEIKVKHFQRNIPVLLAIEQTDKVCIGLDGKYWINNVKRKISLYDSHISFYEKIVHHKKRNIEIAYEDIEFIDINYNQFESGYWGKNYNVFLNAHLYNKEIITFHGAIECDKYHFILAVGMLKKAGIKIVDPYDIYNKALNSDESITHMYDILMDL